MGQANKRGTQEERKAAAIERDRLAMIERESSRVREDTRKGYGTLMALAAIAHGVTLPPRLTGTVRRMDL